MPLIQFAGDVDARMGAAFCAAAAQNGAYFHPKHNMFLSCAHDEAAIDRGLEAAASGFAAVARL